MFSWLGPNPPAYWIALKVVLDEWDMEERIERAWLAEVTPAWDRRRRRFSRRLLAHYPLTQPQDNCQRCLRWTGSEDDPWQLDHIVELYAGGMDHPSNLLRLCDWCHRAKPLTPMDVPAEDRRLIIMRWVQVGPPGGRQMGVMEAEAALRSSLPA